MYILLQKMLTFLRMVEFVSLRVPSQIFLFLLEVWHVYPDELLLCIAGNFISVSIFHSTAVSIWNICDVLSYALLLQLLVKRPFSTY